jgi:hypothetical protein
LITSFNIVEFVEQALSMVWLNLMVLSGVERDNLTVEGAGVLYFWSNESVVRGLF